MSTVMCSVDSLRRVEARRILCKTRATIFGHPNWDNVCLGCGKEIDTQNDYCAACQAQR